MMATKLYGKAVHNSDKKSLFLWCLHCERTYRRGECRVINALQMCPYPDCNGDTVIDAWPWFTVRSYNPEYPVIPIEGTVYPLYPKRAQSQTSKKRKQKAK